MNITSDHLDALEALDREDLIKMVKNIMSGGVVLNFSGKRAAQEIAKRVRPRQTQIIKKSSVGTPEEQARNMIIEGENLQAMVTLYKYRGQIDLILTDPPYNTGEDFRYNDRWDKDPNDPDLGPLVSADDGSRHTKWLRFMTPRIWMMREMLKPGGVIAICIDHRELFRLGMLMDEVFQEENRIGIINWQKSYSPRSANKGLSTATEYILIYAKDAEGSKTNLNERTEAMDVRYNSPDSDPDPWKSGDPSGPGSSTHRRMVYGIQNPFTGDIYYPPEGRHWASEKKTMKEWLEAWGHEYQEKWINDGNEFAEKGKTIRVKALVLKGTAFEAGKMVDGEKILEYSRNCATRRLAEGAWPSLYFGITGKTGPQLKRYLKEVKKGKVPVTYWADEDYDIPFDLGVQSWDHAESGHSQTGINELDAMVGKGHNFRTVKPLRLFQKIIQLWCPSNGIVLDPFAGSGTTGHAILALNNDALTARRFILIEQGSPDKGDKYARSLTQVRVQRAISGERVNNSGQVRHSAEPLPGGFQFRLLTQKIDSRTVLSMRKDELIDVVITSHWETERRGSSGLIRIEDEGYKYLVGRNEQNEGYFLIWNGGDYVGQLDADTYAIVVQEGKKAGLKQPFHVYARYEIYQSRNVVFYKIPDKILAHLGLNENSDSFNEESDD